MRLLNAFKDSELLSRQKHNTEESLLIGRNVTRDINKEACNAPSTKNGNASVY